MSAFAGLAYKARRVRTPAGAEYYGQPIGSFIVTDIPTRMSVHDIESTDEPSARRKGGTGAQVRIITLKDGRKVVKKWVERTTEMDREEWAVRVAEAIGAPVADIKRTGATSAYFEFIDGTVGDDYIADDDVTVMPWDTDTGRILGLLDLLIGNTDRHGGNWIVTPDGPVGIDHGVAFDLPWERDEHGEILPPPIGRLFSGWLFKKSKTPWGQPHWADSIDLHPEDVQWVRERMAELPPMDKDWYAVMLAYLEAIEKRANGSRRLFTHES